MAVICNELTEGIDLSCVRNFIKKYLQDVVLINSHDIDREASKPQIMEGGVNCDYTVSLKLKPGKKGILFRMPQAGSTVKGFTAKTKTDNGVVEYTHNAQLLIPGVTAEQKCILDKLDHGRFVVALQAPDGTVEIFGYENGLSTGDYTLDMVEGGGATVVPLQSDETAKENYLPFVYKPAAGGSAQADFDELFAAP